MRNQRISDHFCYIGMQFLLEKYTIHAITINLKDNRTMIMINLVILHV